jgi:uncharacterized DUF497 family protein
MEPVRFEWDPAKAASNLRKHGVSFEEARTLLSSGVDYLEVYDSEHSEDEDRFLAIGLVPRGVVCVMFVERDEDSIRILGARLATRREQELLERSRRGRKP